MSSVVRIKPKTLIEDLAWAQEAKDILSLDKKCDEEIARHSDVLQAISQAGVKPEDRDAVGRAYALRGLAYYAKFTLRIRNVRPDCATLFMQSNSDILTFESLFTDCDTQMFVRQARILLQQTMDSLATVPCDQLPCEVADIPVMADKKSDEAKQPPQLPYAIARKFLEKAPEYYANAQYSSLVKLCNQILDSPKVELQVGIEARLWRAVAYHALQQLENAQADFNHIRTVNNHLGPYIGISLFTNAILKHGHNPRLHFIKNYLSVITEPNLDSLIKFCHTFIVDFSESDFSKQERVEILKFITAAEVISIYDDANNISQKDEWDKLKVIQNKINTSAPNPILYVEKASIYRRLGELEFEMINLSISYWIRKKWLNDSSVSNEELMRMNTSCYMRQMFLALNKELFSKCLSTFKFFGVELSNFFQYEIAAFEVIQNTLSLKKFPALMQHFILIKERSKSSIRELKEIQKCIDKKNFESAEVRLISMIDQSPNRFVFSHAYEQSQFTLLVMHLLIGKAIAKAHICKHGNPGKREEYCNLAESFTKASFSNPEDQEVFLKQIEFIRSWKPKEKSAESKVNEAPVKPVADAVIVTLDVDAVASAPVAAVSASVVDPSVKVSESIVDAALSPVMATKITADASAIISTPAAQAVKPLPDSTPLPSLAPTLKVESKGEEKQPDLSAAELEIKGQFVTYPQSVLIVFNRLSEFERVYVAGNLPRQHLVDQITGKHNPKYNPDADMVVGTDQDLHQVLIKVFHKHEANVTRMPGGKLGYIVKIKGIHKQVQIWHSKALSDFSLSEKAALEKDSRERGMTVDTFIGKRPEPLQNKGKILQPCKRAHADLNAGLVKPCKEANECLTEDMDRVFRFVARKVELNGKYTETLEKEIFALPSEVVFQKMLTEKTLVITIGSFKKLFCNGRAVKNLDELCRLSLLTKLGFDQDALKKNQFIRPALIKIDNNYNGADYEREQIILREILNLFVRCKVIDTTHPVFTEFLVKPTRLQAFGLWQPVESEPLGAGVPVHPAGPVVMAAAPSAFSSLGGRAS